MSPGSGGGTVEAGSSNEFVVFQRCTVSTFVTDIETMMLHKSYLYIKARFLHDGADILRRLGATILGREITCCTTEDWHFIDLRYGRKWASIDKFFFILHPDDPYSCLILENRDENLKITLQGRWQQDIGEEISKLAAEWVSANMPPAPPKQSGWKEPKVTSGDTFV